VPEVARRLIGPPKLMVTVFSNPRGLCILNCFPEGNRFNAAYLVEQILSQFQLPRDIQSVKSQAKIFMIHLLPEVIKKSDPWTTKPFWLVNHQTQKSVCERRTISPQDGHKFEENMLNLMGEFVVCLRSLRMLAHRREYSLNQRIERCFGSTNSDSSTNSEIMFLLNNRENCSSQSDIVPWIHRTFFDSLPVIHEIINP
jgi:hypothetical protein